MIGCVWPGLTLWKAWPRGFGSTFAFHFVDFTLLLWCIQQPILLILLQRKLVVCGYRDGDALAENEMENDGGWLPACLLACYGLHGQQCG